MTIILTWKNLSGLSLELSSFDQVSTKSTRNIEASIIQVAFLNPLSLTLYMQNIESTMFSYNNYVTKLIIKFLYACTHRQYRYYNYINKVATHHLDSILNYLPTILVISCWVIFHETSLQANLWHYYIKFLYS